MSKRYSLEEAGKWLQKHFRKMRYDIERYSDEFLPVRGIHRCKREEYNKRYLLGQNKL